MPADTTSTEAELQSRLDPAKRQSSVPEYLELIPPIYCADGLSFSMQTGRTRYCAPRRNEAPWASVEIGFPSRRVDEFMPYIDGADEDPKDTVYGYVPLTVVAAVVDAAGGLAEAPASILADEEA